MEALLAVLVFLAVAGGAVAAGWRWLRLGGGDPHDPPRPAPGRHRAP